MTTSWTPLACRSTQCRCHAMGCAQPINGRLSGSRRAPCLGRRFVKDYVHGRTGARTRTGRDPPQHLRLQLAARRPSRFFVQASIGLCDRQPRETIRAVARSRSAVPSLCPCAIESSTSPEDRNDFVRTPMSTSAGVIRTLARILAKHTGWHHFPGTDGSLAYATQADGAGSSDR
jgi:hypothetical protein